MKMAIPYPQDRFTRIPVTEVTKIPENGGFYDVIKNCWWGIDKNNNILLFQGFARQCNSNESIAKRLIEHEDHPAIKAQLLETVFLPHKCEDYVNY